ncbi:2-oxoglutarate dehydrogenase complex dihydrolipoyllysine-residue succinyltransferase [candidate division KSB1 bacterium]
MIIEIKVPSPGESITQVQLATWLVNDEDYVEKDQDIAEVDSDKATLSIPATESGNIQFKVQEGETIDVGHVIATINTSSNKGKATKTKETVLDNQFTESKELQQKENQKKQDSGIKKELKSEGKPQIHISPLARKLMNEKNINENELIDFFKNLRISKEDVGFYLEHKDNSLQINDKNSWKGSREVEKQKMSTLRIKLAERLVSVKNETAMLTTFNEVNMGPIIELRKQYKDVFKEKYGVSLGYMSFFTKAVTEGIQHFPKVNSMLDGDEIIMHKYVDIGIAVSAPKGLMVPVIRNAEMLTIPEIEIKVTELAIKARNNKITLDEMAGSTFTITNGGVFGSMMSTPIINPPQSAILGMHNIVDRPVAIDGKVEIRPIMYLALSYDHRIVDGKESVSFLVKIKELLENPVNMLFAGEDPIKVLLGL